MKDKGNEPVKPIERSLSKYCHTFNSEECDCGKYCNYEKEYGEYEPDPEPMIPLAEAFKLMKFANVCGYDYNYYKEAWEDEDGYLKTDSELLDIFRTNQLIKNNL